MYAALNEKQVLEYASHQIIKKPEFRKWTCPDCGQRVDLKLSQKGKMFFAHRQGCGTAKKSQQKKTQESSRHIKSKEQIASYFSRLGYSVDLEYHLHETNQFADVWIQLEDQATIIEFQRSKISAKHLIERTFKYQKLGLRCVWLIDFANFKSNPFNTWQMKLLQYSDDLNYYLLFYDVEVNQIFWVSHFPLVTRLPIQYLLTRTDLNTLITYQPTQIISMGTPHQHRPNLKNYNYQNRLHQLRKSKQYQRVIQKYYSFGMTLDKLPPQILTSHWESTIFKTPTWVVLGWLYILKTQTGLDHVDENIVHYFLKDLVGSNRILLAETPFILDKNKLLRDVSASIISEWERSR